MDLLSTSHIFHLISGSFRSHTLFLLAFDPARRTIHHVQTVSELGPHQYLATNQHKDRVYTTTRWLLYLFLVQIPSKFTPVILLDNLPISPRLLHLVGLLLMMDHDMSKSIQMGRCSIALQNTVRFNLPLLILLILTVLNPANFLDLYEIITIDSAIGSPSLNYTYTTDSCPSFSICTLYNDTW